ncbi:MAG TPA: penicillin acylase family protein [Myxococcaceae bacterium]
MPKPTPWSRARETDSELRYTDYAVAHIRADDFGSAGFGQGYAVAREHACTLVDQLVKVRGERSRYLGAGPGSLQSVLARSSIILLDGSTSRDEWVVAPGSRSPGLVPTPSTPRLTRRDVVVQRQRELLATPPHRDARGLLSAARPCPGAPRRDRAWT